MTQPTLPDRFNLARYCLEENVRLRPDAVALTIVSGMDAGQSWSFAQVDDIVRRLGAGFADLDLGHGERLQPGARIMIRMGNDADYVFSYFAAIAAGFIAMPSSPQLTEEEARFLASDAGVSLIILADDAAAMPGFHTLRTRDLAALKASAPLAGYADTKADDPAYLIYTSGTTSKPKGVLHAQRAAFGRRPMHEHWLGIGAGDTMLHAGTINWTYTLGVGLLDPWANGATAVLYNGPRDAAIWPALIARHHATIFAAVPGVYRQMLKSADLASHDLSSLRHGLTAGEAMAPALYEAWRKATGKELYEALGMSEISTYVSSGPTTPVRIGSPGRPQPGRRVAILPVEEGETPLPAGETGLLAVHRSDPALMLHYWNRPDEDEATRRGEWFIGGDLAHLDADGYLHYHGRNDDVMNALGYRVSPAEVEAALLSHPDVADVAVIDTFVREDLSLITGFVVLHAGRIKDEAALISHAGLHLASYKCPRRIVFVDELPRTGNGKLQRKRLRQTA